MTTWRCRRSLHSQLLASISLLYNMVKPLLFLLATAAGSLAQGGNGILGFGLVCYNPVCAATCATVSSLTILSCTNIKGHKHLNQLSMSDNPPACLQTNDPYLTTTAYCIQQRCQGQAIERLEGFWRTQVGRLTGSLEKAQRPKWTYQETLSNIHGPPNTTLVLKRPLESDCCNSGCCIQNV